MSENLSEKIYRLGPWYGSLLSPFMVCTLGINIFFVNQFYTENDSFTNRSSMAALIFLALTGFMFVAIVGAHLVYLRWMRLILSDRAITKIEGTEAHIISVDQISHINWLSISGEIIVESPDAKIRVALDDFKRSDQSDIIDFLRNAVTLEQQEKWDTFSESHRRSIDPHVPLTTRERFVTAFWFILAGLFGYMWWNESELLYLVSTLLFLLGAIRSYRGK